MKGPLIAVIAVGAGLGMMLPNDPPAAADGAAAPASALPSAAAATSSTAAAPPASWQPETRLKPGPGGHFHTKVLVNGQPVEMMVDTGATTIALTTADARRIGIPFSPSSFTVIGSGASGPVRGQPITIESVSVDGKEVRTLSGAVLEGLDVSLLGQSYLSRISEVRMRGGEMVLR